jgi:hypothetical protein
MRWPTAFRSKARCHSLLIISMLFDAYMSRIQDVARMGNLRADTVTRDRHTAALSHMASVLSGAHLGQRGIALNPCSVCVSRLPTVCQS